MVLEKVEIPTELKVPPTDKLLKAVAPETFKVPPRYKFPPTPKPPLSITEPVVTEVL